jgi:uncharacterized membrane protein YgcG
MIRRSHPRHRPEHDDAPAERQLAPVLADQPIVAHRLLARFRLMLILFAVAIVLFSAGAGWAAARWSTDTSYRRASSNTDKRIKALERDRQNRSRQRDEQTAALEREIAADRAQAHTDVCAAIAHQPNDNGGPVSQLRARYRCPYSPAPAASGTGGSAAPPGGGSSNSSGSGSGQPPGGGQPRPTGNPPPSTAPPTTPPPTTPPPCLLRLPLLGCVL